VFQSNPVSVAFSLPRPWGTASNIECSLERRRFESLAPICFPIACSGPLQRALRDAETDG